MIIKDTMDLLLFGAGKIGHSFIKSDCFKKLNYDHVFFYDNNKNLPHKIDNIERVEDIRYVAKDTEIIITCTTWRDVFRQCVGSSYYNIKIYDENLDKILSIKEYCKIHPGYYENTQCAIYQMEKSTKVAVSRKRFIETYNLFENITEVAIMLSNLCNYADIHVKCPASCVREKQILPSKVVYKILDELAQSKFDGTICFHVYNEPLIDPRLFLFIQYAKGVMPLCKVKIYSNGYYLNQTMVQELNEIGTDALITTGYGKNEYERLIDLDVKMPFSVLLGNFDNRLKHYSEKNVFKDLSNEACYSYLAQVPIYSNGDIGTCCLDYMHPYLLGNINEHSLKECLNDTRMVSFQMDLLKGKRSKFPICANCSCSIGVND